VNIIITRKRIVKEFANRIANLQKKADKWFYVSKNQEMSSYILDRVIPIKEMCEDLGIVKQVYEEAYKIYDFRNSGKSDFKPDLDKLKT
jgi:hypothetical protein